MRALIQRVTSARVTVEHQTVGSINTGLVILLGICSDDAEKDARFLAEKVANLRVFADEAGRFDRSAHDTGAEFLVVSQFTLYGDCRKGRRPNFTQAARPELAEPLYHFFVAKLREFGFRVETGRFGAMMQVDIHNDGPVTLLLESKSSA